MVDKSSELFGHDIRDMFSFDVNEKEVDLQKLHSSFWMKQLPTKQVDLITLASYRRAIARFVRITTNMDIPVHFSSGNESYTDMKTKVVLSAKIKNSEFDVAVGTSLHESNHIKHTDKDIMPRVFAWDNDTKTFTNPLPKRIYEEAKRLGLSKNEVMAFMKVVFNVVEDRRIDAISYNENPGYRMYYQAMYKKYWCSPQIDKVMASELYRHPVYMSTEGKSDPLGSYSFRIINIVNKYTDLDALPGLRDIWNVLDLETVAQMNGTEEAYNVAVKITEIVLRNLPDPSDSKSNEADDGKDSNENKDGEQGEGGSSDGKSNDPDVSDLPNLDSNPSGSGGEVTEEDIRKAKKAYDSLSDKEKEKLQKQMKKLQDFINGEEEKKSLSPDQQKKLDAIEKSGMTLENVDKKTDSSGNTISSTNVLVVRKLTKDILSTLRGLNSYMSTNTSQKAVDAGFRLGRLLAKKLSIRNDTKYYHSKRKTSGKLDKRMLYNLGMNNTSVFEKVRKDAFSDALVHISIDASGSMDGDEWENSLTAAVAIAYAADKTKNMNVIISFRSVENYASMVVGYDSRTDNISKIKTLFPYLSPNGSQTPEGLCFEAIMKDIITASQGKKSYFINFSDGMPNMGTQLHSPYEITKNAVTKMKANGIKILSFFINKWSNNDSTFKEMYGQNARTIDVTAIVPLAKELNKMFATDK